MTDLLIQYSRAVSAYFLSLPLHDDPLAKDSLV